MPATYSQTHPCPLRKGVGKRYRTFVGKGQAEPVCGPEHFDSSEVCGLLFVLLRRDLATTARTPLPRENSQLRFTCPPEEMLMAVPHVGDRFCLVPYNRVLRPGARSQARQTCPDALLRCTSYAGLARPLQRGTSWTASGCTGGAPGRAGRFGLPRLVVVGECEPMMRLDVHPGDNDCRNEMLEIRSSRPQGDDRAAPAWATKHGRAERLPARVFRRRCPGRRPRSASPDQLAETARHSDGSGVCSSRQELEVSRAARVDGTWVAPHGPGTVRPSCG